MTGTNCDLFTHKSSRSYLNHLVLISLSFHFLMGRDSSVGMATFYGLDGPGIDLRWGQDFSHLFKPALGPTQSLIHWVHGLFPGVKWPGRGVDHPITSSTEVKERVELYLNSPSVPSRKVYKVKNVIFYFLAKTNFCYEIPSIVCFNNSVSQYVIDFRDLVAYILICHHVAKLILPVP